MNKNAERKQQIIDYRRAHHSIKETAERFNVGTQYVKHCCTGLFIGYASGKHPCMTLEEREQEAKRQIEERWKWAEYVDGYTGSGGMVNIRCRQCGAIVRKSFICVRHYDENTTCPICSKVHIRNTLRIKTYMGHWEAEERARIKKQPKPRKPTECRSGPHPCQVCGKITTRPKYCSSDCARKASNAKHDVKKRKFMKDKVIDKDITLKKLFNRDRGVCWICGQMCDYGDYERKNGHFIAGNRYPSIDHIIPRCEGGEHSWANIKLAHRICNTDSFKWMRKDSTKRHIAV